MIKLFSIISALFVIMASSMCMAKDYSAHAEHCEPIRDTVEHILTNEGVMPDYFMLLAAESHCHNDRKSKAGAVGVWQMMPRTAKKYGCDDPLDIECATHAAARYLKHLEEKCGADNAILCWHDGGSNFLKKGATKAAKGLQWQVMYFIRTDTRV